MNAWRSAFEANRQAHDAFARVPVRVYSMVEVSYRDGNSETFPPDYRFVSDDADPRVLWVMDSKGPVYRRALNRVESISLKEVAA